MIKTPINEFIDLPVYVTWLSGLALCWFAYTHRGFRTMMNNWKMFWLIKNKQFNIRKKEVYSNNMFRTLNSLEGGKLKSRWPFAKYIRQFWVQVIFLAEENTRGATLKYWTSTRPWGSRQCRQCSTPVDLRCRLRATRPPPLRGAPGVRASPWPKWL